MIHKIYDLGVIIQCKIPFATYRISKITVWNNEIRVRVNYPNEELVGVLRITEDGLLINTIKQLNELMIYAILVDEGNTFNLNYLYNELLREFKEKLATPLYEGLDKVLSKMHNISLVTLDTYKMKDIKVLVEQYNILEEAYGNAIKTDICSSAKALGDINRFFKELSKF